jgi:hypothetical protein
MSRLADHGAEVREHLAAIVTQAGRAVGEASGRSHESLMIRAVASQPVKEIDDAHRALGARVKG